MHSSTVYPQPGVASAPQSQPPSPDSPPLPPSLLTRHSHTISIPHKQPSAIPLQRRIQLVQRLQTDAGLIRHILAVLAALLLDPRVAFTADARLGLFGRGRAARTGRIRGRGSRRRRGADAVRVAGEEARAVALQRRVQRVQLGEGDPRAVGHVLAVLAVLLLDPFLAPAGDPRLGLLRGRDAAGAGSGGAGGGGGLG